MAASVPASCPVSYHAASEAKNRPTKRERKRVRGLGRLISVLSNDLILGCQTRVTTPLCNFTIMSVLAWPSALCQCFVYLYISYFLGTNFVSFLMCYIYSHASIVGVDDRRIYFFNFKLFSMLTFFHLKRSLVFFFFQNC